MVSNMLLRIVALLACLLAMDESYILRPASQLCPQPWCGVGSPRAADRALFGRTETTPIREVMTFGNRVDIQLTLPSRDRSTVTDFLQDELALLDATWEKGKFTRLGSPSDNKKKYLLYFPKLVLPGVDTISPEIEVEFRYANGLIEMHSGNWTLRGDSGNVLKDSRFVESFNIIVLGELGIPHSAQPTGELETTPIVARGWVEYRVKGEKPSVFRNAPPFVLDVTIKLIQDTVSEFATSQFSTRLLRGFRQYVMNRTHNFFRMTTASSAGIYDSTKSSGGGSGNRLKDNNTRTGD